MLRAGSSIGLAAWQLLPGGAPSALLEAVRTRKLRELLRHAYERVPFYRHLYRAGGIEAQDLRDPQVLVRLPTVTKQQLRRAGADLLSDAHRGSPLAEERTSGSSGEPFSMRFEREYVVARNFRYLRGLFSVGYKPGKKLLSISEHADERRSNLPRWQYCALEAEPAAQAEQFCRFEPEFLYGPMTSLRLLADHLRNAAVSFRAPRCVISTGEMLDEGTRRKLEQVFRAAVADFYGLTETGLVAWQRGRGDAYVVASEGIVVERIAEPGDDGRYRLVITNLDLHAMPIIRYDTGDVGTFEHSAGSSAALTRIDGRSVDCIVGPDGRLWSPFQLTMALQPVAGIERFRIRQTAPAHVEVELESSRDDGSDVSQQAIAALQRVLGDGFRIEPRLRDRLVVDPGSKFRVVESYVRATADRS